MLTSAQFVRFLATGGTSAIFNLIVRYCLNLYLSFETSVALAYLVGMVIAYLLARLFVFDASGHSTASEFYRFAVINLFSLMLVWGISVTLARVVFPRIGLTWHADDIAHFIGLVPLAVTSFLGHRSFTFRRV